jgi:iron complex transport system ATP-binding protein
MLKVDSLTVSYGSLKILDNVSFELQKQQWLMIVGPNGAGKSTVIKAVTQCVPYSGKVTLDGKDIAHIRPHALARSVAVLSQNYHIGYAFTVEEIVSLGRYAWKKGLFAKDGADIDDRIDHALEITGLKKIRHQSVLTLSGGELQRTFLAQIFAQDPRLLILDEPTNHLDLVYQKQTFELISEWLKQPGRAVISVVHDLSLAKAYGSHALLLNEGHHIASGNSEQVLANDNLSKVYNMDVQLWMQQLLANWQN